MAGASAGQYVGDLTPDQQWAAFYASQKAAAERAGTNAGTKAASALTALTGAGGAGGNGGSLSLPSLGGLSGGAVGGGVNTGSAPGVSPLAMQDTSAADAANLSRTKDAVGKQSAGALRGLRESLGARGMLGSGLESRGTEQIAEAGLGEQGDVARQQQINNSNRAQDTAKTNYQGAIAMRGQDLNAQQEAARQRQAALTGLMSFINSSGSLY